MFVRSTIITLLSLILTTALVSSPLFAEEKSEEDSGEYNISVRSGSTNVHQTFDKDGNPIQTGEEILDIKKERQSLHKDRKRTRNERKKALREEKKAAKEAKRESR